MVRRSVRIAYLIDSKKRNTTFRKRKIGFLKKVAELSTLCGVDTCAIIFRPNEPEPDVWPSSEGAKDVVRRFKMVPEKDQRKKMVNREDHAKKNIATVTRLFHIKQQANHEKELATFMLEGNKEVLKGLKMVDLNDLQKAIEKSMEYINGRIEFMAINNNNGASSSRTSALPAFSLTPEEITKEFEHLTTTDNNNASSGAAAKDDSVDADSTEESEDSESDWLDDSDTDESDDAKSFSSDENSA
ncbi:hypothetical protein ACFE04_027941 [Oxalis oulophora]